MAALFGQVLAVCAALCVGVPPLAVVIGTALVYLHLIRTGRSPLLPWRPWTFPAPGDRWVTPEGLTYLVHDVFFDEVAQHWLADTVILDAPVGADLPAELLHAGAVVPVAVLNANARRVATGITVAFIPTEAP